MRKMNRRKGIGRDVMKMRGYKDSCDEEWEMNRRKERGTR